LGRRNALALIAPYAAMFGAPGYSVGLALIGFSLGWLAVGSDYI